MGAKAGATQGYFVLTLDRSRGAEAVFDVEPADDSAAPENDVRRIFVPSRHKLLNEISRIAPQMGKGLFVLRVLDDVAVCAPGIDAFFQNVGIGWPAAHRRNELAE